MATYTRYQNKSSVMGKILFFPIFCIFFSTLTSAIFSDEGIHYFSQLDSIDDDIRSRRDTRTFSSGNAGSPDGGAKMRNIRETGNQDAKCTVISKDRISEGVSSYLFNDSNENLALMWTGDHGQSILALTTLEYFIFAAPSHLWVSKDFGKTFQNADSKINGATIKEKHGVLRHKTSFNKVVLMSYPGPDPYKSKLYITTDRGDSLEEVITVSYPETDSYKPKYSSLLMAGTDDYRSLHYLLPTSPPLAGMHWRRVQECFERPPHLNCYQCNFIFVFIPRLYWCPYPETDPYKSKLYITTDGGDSFEEVETEFTPEGPLMASPYHPDWILAHSPNQDYKLWFSGDFGRTWREVKKNVIEFYWGTAEQNTEAFLFMSVMPEGKRLDNPQTNLLLSLIRSDPYGKNERTIKYGVYNFGCQGKFLFAATDQDGTDPKNKTKVLHVSTDGGNKWNIAQVPGIFGDMFFAVLDMSEGMIILHVDDAGDTGHGKLYTSDGDGIVFSLSLDKHLFPNHETVTDFYKVQSMRGVYMASQMDRDDGIHTMISFDRAGEWDYVDAPNGTQCRAGVKPCKLQIHSRYSQQKQIKVPSVPISIPQAPGLILAHGNVADGLETSDPDVFVTSDGGYNWNKALDGPHQYAITNFGGLIVAISKSQSTTDTIHFSYDEGHCWHHYNFTNEPLVITGLLPEPSSKSLNVSIWGFGADDRQWRAFTIDFSKVLTAECTDDDFLVWKPHEQNGKSGCFLGRKETFLKVRPDAFCRIKNEFEVKARTSDTCECQKVDYECDYGFYRQDGDDKCQLSADVDINDLDICQGGEKEEIKTQGYRKIPGDVCTGGYQPHRVEEDLHVRCSGYAATKNHKLTVAVLLALLSVLIIVITAFFYIQSNGLCKRKSRGIYRYSELSQGDNEEQVLDVSPGPDTYHDDSDEDMLA